MVFPVKMLCSLYRADLGDYMRHISNHRGYKLQMTTSHYDYFPPKPKSVAVVPKLPNTSGQSNRKRIQQSVGVPVGSFRLLCIISVSTCCG